MTRLFFLPYQSLAPPNYFIYFHATKLGTSQVKFVSDFSNRQLDRIVFVKMLKYSFNGEHLMNPMPMLNNCSYRETYLAQICHNMMRAKLEKLRMKNMKSGPLHTLQKSYVCHLSSS